MQLSFDAKTFFRNPTWQLGTRLVGKTVFLFHVPEIRRLTALKNESVLQGLHVPVSIVGNMSVFSSLNINLLFFKFHYGGEMVQSVSPHIDTQIFSLFQHTVPFDFQR